jgi:ABC-2 type transport system permease protein
MGDGLAAAERLLLKLRHDPAAIVLTLGAPVALVVIFGRSGRPPRPPSTGWRASC